MPAPVRPVNGSLEWSVIGMADRPFDNVTCKNRPRAARGEVKAPHSTASLRKRPFSAQRPCRITATRVELCSCATLVRRAL